MPSPRPLPTNLKVIRGTARPCRLNEKEPKPEKLKIIKAPSYLNKDEKKCWREVVSELQQCGIATRVDKPALIAYCKCWVVWRSETSIIESEGTVVKGCMGNDVVSPHIRIANESFKQLLSLWREFGMTPSSRTRIRSEIDKPDDDFEVWQSKRKISQVGV